MLKLFESFKEIEGICREYKIKNYTINSDGSIDVNGDVALNNRLLKSLPLKFNEISGYFDCRENQLTSLYGSPRKVRRGFYCNNNQLTSLKGAPEEVGGNFYCHHNLLRTLKGSPRKVITGGFDCSNNKIWTFEDAPDYVTNFNCDDNPIYEIWRLFEDYSKLELFNYYDIIREVDGKPAVVMERLNDFLEEIGKPMTVKGYLSI